MKALEIIEYRASYARFFFDDKVAVGLNLKALEGETRYRKYSMRDLEEGEELIEDITEEKNTKRTTQFDADIGILYTPFERLSLGITAKHLASPEFDFAAESSADPIKLEPQVRLGAALRPFKSLILAADTDLTTNESEILDGYKSRQVGVGAEWKPFGFIALRVGGYNNIESDETGWVYTAGLGLRIWKLGFDVSGAMAAEEQEIGSGEDREKIRERYSFAAALKFSTAF
ncbi:MAG: conjugal transfer protein TraF [Desulfobacterales bacterium]|nr:conjugal transfer protein TraF [Desulfobacterales bacterium]